MKNCSISYPQKRFVLFCWISTRDYVKNKLYVFVIDLTQTQTSVLWVGLIVGDVMMTLYEHLNLSPDSYI